MKSMDVVQIDSEVLEPEKTGTSMKYLGGKPFKRYVLWLTFANSFGTAI